MIRRDPEELRANFRSQLEPPRKATKPIFRDNRLVDPEAAHPMARPRQRKWKMFG
jgi:hypothetical protein